MNSPLPANVRPELSVVILGYREEDHLPAFIARVESEVRSLGLSYELVLVANYWPGTGDRTPEIAAQLARQYDHLKTVARPKEGMMGWDMRSGFQEACGEVIAVIDGDGQFQPHDIVRVYHVLKRNDLDLCQTYRLDRQDGWVRKAASWIYNALFRALFPRVSLRDVNSKPKLLTRKAYQSLDLTSSDWFIDAEIIIQARRKGLRMGEIASVFVKKEGKSYINPATVLEFLRNFVRYRLREYRYQIRRWRGREPLGGRRG